MLEQLSQNFLAVVTWNGVMLSNQQSLPMHPERDFA